MKKYLFILILFSMFCVMAEPVLAQDQPITGGLSAGCISNGNCELSDFMRVFLNVARFILGLSGSVALLAFVIGGFMMMASGDNKNSRRILERCSAMILDLDSVPDLMEAMLENGESKKDKKRKKKQEIKLGLESLAFKKKKKNKGW
jgi:hypothetical protein